VTFLLAMDESGLDLYHASWFALATMRFKSYRKDGLKNVLFVPAVSRLQWISLE